MIWYVTNAIPKKTIRLCFKFINELFVQVQIHSIALGRIRIKVKSGQLKLTDRIRKYVLLYYYCVTYVWEMLKWDWEYTEYRVRGSRQAGKGTGMGIGGKRIRKNGRTEEKSSQSASVRADVCMQACLENID